MHPWAAGQGRLGGTLRVLFLTHRLPYPPNRGDRIRAYHLLRVIAGSAEVSLLSLVHSDEEERQARHLQALATVTTVRIPRTSNLISAAMALPGRQPLTHVLLNSPEVGRAIREMVGMRSPDVVLAYCSGMAQYLYTPPLAGLPAVLDMVDLDSEKWQALSRTANWPMHSIYRREALRLQAFEKVATDTAAATTVVNERERTAVLSINPDAAVRVISNGIDAAHFRSLKSPSDTSNVVFCGVFNYRPNEMGAIWLAKEVWPLVRRRVPSATLTLVGMDPTRNVRQLAADRSITVTGAVPDVRPYLWRSAVAAAPLAVSRGIQNKVLEALAAGLPSVVTPSVAAGLPAAVLPGCEIASTPTEFANSLTDLLNAAPADRCYRAHAACLDTLTWDSQLMPMVDLLRSVTRSESATPVLT